MFTAVFLKAQHGYVAFIEELPDITSYGETIEAARSALHQLAAVVFDAERENARTLVAGKEVLREAFVMHGAHGEAEGR